MDLRESFLCGYLRIQGAYIFVINIHVLHFSVMLVWVMIHIASKANLHFQGLTEDHPTLTTYFEGEIIGSKYSFFTQHDDWGANPTVDLNHWGKFSAFRQFYKCASRSTMSMNDVAQKENIFMRWKEHFLVPDHRVRTITGASFEGFYYICFNQLKGEVSGIYFHSKSEK